MENESEKKETTAETLEPVREAPQPAPAPAPAPTYYAPSNASQNIPEEYKPISMWGYFGYELLFSIPCVGFILLCVFAFGGARNINLRNFARSYFCFLIIGLILAAIFFVLMMMFGVSANNINYR